MKEVKFDDLKKIQLDILEDVHDFCIKNGIRYYLYYGTLLGAIRHEGYIPWDDDIDIAMPRDDYEIFLKKYKSKCNYRVISYENNRDFLFAYAKVYDDNTLFVENSNLKAKFGINIDIFPIDNIVSNKQIKMIYNFKKIINVKLIKYSKNRSLRKNIILFISKFFVHFIPSKYVIKKMISLAKLGLNTQVEYVDAISAGFSSDIKISKKLFSDFITTNFEGKEFIIPANYDKILTTIYGNYMLFPPIEEQIAHHDYKAYYK